jgi:ParB/Sulfiredoxin domain
MTIEWWDMDRVTPYEHNARTLSPKAIDKVAASLKEFGWRQPIVADRQGIIVCGHTRLLAAQKLGMRQVPVHVATDLTPAQIKAYRLADNRTNQETDWNLQLLAPEISDLRGPSPTWLSWARLRPSWRRWPSCSTGPWTARHGASVAQRWPSWWLSAPGQLQSPGPFPASQQSMSSCSCLLCGNHRGQRPWSTTSITLVGDGSKAILSEKGRWRRNRDGCTRAVDRWVIADQTTRKNSAAR